jgi:hypothetical protein
LSSGRESGEYSPLQDNNEQQAKGFEMRLLPRIAAFVLAAGASFANAAELTWTGSASNLWSNASNWNPAAAPGSGDSLTFPPGASNLANTNDLPGLTLAGTFFQTNGYVLGGNGITLANQVISGGAGVNEIALPVHVPGAVLLYGGGNTSYILRLTGDITGSGTLTMMNSLVSVAGSGTFSGTFALQGGPLRMEGASFPSAQVTASHSGNGLVGNGVIGAVSVARLSPGPSAAVGTSIQNGVGVLQTGNLSGNDFDIDLNGTVAGVGHDQIVVNGTVSLSGSLNVGIGFIPAPGHVFTIIDNDGADPVSGTFAGLAEGATLTAGSYTLQVSYAGGTGNDVTLTVLTKAWSGAVNGLWSEPGNWGGVLPVNGDTLVFPPGAANKASTNDLNGLVLNTIQLNDGGYTLAGNGIVLTTAVSSDPSVGENTIAFPLNLQANAVTFSAGAAALRFTGAVSGTGSIAVPRAFVSFAGSHAFSGTVTCGAVSPCLRLEAATMPAVTLSAGATASITGNGSIASVSAARVAPGSSSTAVATTNNGVATLATGSIAGNAFEMDVEGVAAGTGYDQVIVTGTVTLGGDLVLRMAITPPFGQVFRLIDNDGADPVVGTFTGLPEGAGISAGGHRFVISYIGGDGNDVTLTAVTNTWSGAVNGLWSEPGNWTSGVVPGPGHELRFPAGAANKANTNDLNGLALYSIFFGEGGYTLSGNGITLAGNITADVSVFGTNTIAMPVDTQNHAVMFSAGASGGQGPLRFTGAISGTGTITVNRNFVSIVGAHPFSGTFSLTCGSVTNCLRLESASLPSASVTAGSAVIFGDGTLGGTVTGASISPGGTAARGRVTTGNLTLSRLTFELRGAIPGVLYDQVKVNGTFGFSSPSLQPNVSGFVPYAGQVIVLIDNDGVDAVVGTFAGIPEGFTLAIGAFSYRVSYVGGDGNDVTLLSLNGRPAPVITASSSPNPSAVGETVTLTATVSGGVTPTGTVTFFNGTTELGSATLDGSGVATLVTSALGVGSHSVIAAYAGDASHGNGASAAVNHVVKHATGTSVSSSANPAQLGASITFTATVTGSGSPTGTVTFRDGATFLAETALAGGTAAFTTSSLPLGSRAITAQYNGDATNLASSGTLAGGQTVVDSSAPDTGLVAFPAAITSATSATFGFVGTDGSGSGVATFECRLDAGAFSACTSPRSYTGLAPGAHTFEVRAIDGVGNPDPTPASYAWTIATAATSVTIAAPAAITAANQASYGVSGNCTEAGRSVDVQVGSVATTATCVGGAYATATMNVSALAQGAVSITAMHSSAAGNTGTATASTTKDTLGPALTIDALDNVNNANKAAYGFAGNCETTGGAVTYTLASGAASNGSVACSGGRFTVAAVNVTALNDGTVAVSVTQQDALGNATTTNGSVPKDTVNPSVTIDAPVAVTSVNQATYLVTGTCSETGRTVTVSAGGVMATAPCGTPTGGYQVTLDLTALAQGPVAFSAALTDLAGNSASATANAAKDSVAAPPVILLPAASSTVPPNPAISGNGAEPGATVTVREGTTTVCTATADGSGAWSCASTLGAGNHTVTATQADAAGNTSAPSAARSFAVGVPSANPPRLGNISTRLRVLTGNEVMISGFVIGGSESKTVAVVATGPSLSAFGIANPLANPTLTVVRSSDQSVIATNDDWQLAANASQLQSAGFAPGHPLEPGLLLTLPPGAYTAIVAGANGGTGVSVAAVYEVDKPLVPVTNMSTRGLVQTGDNVMIAGFVVQGDAPQTVTIVATGPSLAAFGITNPLANPTMTLVRSSDQAVLATNDDWQSASNAADIQASGFAPPNPAESAIRASLPPGAYTVIVSGAGATTGVAVVGIYPN